MGENREISKFAKISLVFGIFAFLFGCCYGGILGIVGLVYGAFVWIENRDGKVVALLGMILSLCAIVATVAMVLVGSSVMKSGEYDAYYREMYEKMFPESEQTNTTNVTDEN